MYHTSIKRRILRFICFEYWLTKEWVLGKEFLSIAESLLRLECLDESHEAANKALKCLALVSTDGLNDNEQVKLWKDKGKAHLLKSRIYRKQGKPLRAAVEGKRAMSTGGPKRLFCYSHLQASRLIYALASALFVVPVACQLVLHPGDKTKYRCFTAKWNESILSKAARIFLDFINTTHFSHRMLLVASGFTFISAHCWGTHIGTLSVLVGLPVGIVAYFLLRAATKSIIRRVPEFEAQVPDDIRSLAGTKSSWDWIWNVAVRLMQLWAKCLTVASKTLSLSLSFFLDWLSRWVARTRRRKTVYTAVTFLRGGGSLVDRINLSMRYVAAYRIRTVFTFLPSSSSSPAIA